MRARLMTACLAALLSAVPAAAQLWKPEPGLTVWVDADYKGARRTFTADTPDLTGTGFERVISSLTVGKGESWQVCMDANYGRCRTVTSGLPNLRDLVGWNDAIMSVRRTPAQPGPPSREPVVAAPPVAAPPPVVLGPARGLELYAGTNYSGRRQVLQDATANFRALDFNDRPMSLRVPRNETWEICVNIDFDECRLVSEDIADLSAIGISRMISSARPHYSRGRGGRPQLVYYDGVNFRGRSTLIEEDRPSFGTSTAAVGSVRVLGGEWQVCDRPRFFGNCVVVSGDVRDLTRLGLRGPVASLRRNQER
jgi:hypothetical protein